MSYKDKRDLDSQESEDESDENEIQNKYIDAEAEEDNDDESEEYQMTEKERLSIEESKRLYGSKNLAREDFAQKLRNPEKLAEEARQRDEEQRLAEMRRNEMEYISSLPERDPDKDYPIFAIRCKQGYEKDICMRIMKIWINQKDRTMHLFSVFVPKEKTGIVYIEAMTERKFADACDGVRDLYINTIHALNDKQIEELLVSRMPTTIEPNSYVRINAEPYKGDLGVVVETTENKKVIVKLVPRFNIAHFQEIAKKMRLKKEREANGEEDVEDEEKNPRKRVPPKALNLTKQLFNPVELGISDVCLPDEDENGMTVYHFNKTLFYDGFIFKTYKMSQLVFNDIVPTQEEAVQFAQGEEMPAKGKLRYEKERNYKEGDLVIIINPDEHVQGKKTKIVHIDGDKIIVMGNELDTPITLSKEDVSIYFNVGDRVKVTDGMYANETGIIEAIKGDEVFVFTDKKKSSICVSQIDLENTEEINQEITVLNGYYVNDFVQLSEGVGLILEILPQNNKLLVLNDSNKTQEVDPSVIQGKFQERRDARCRDRNRNYVSLGDLVNIVSGVYSGRVAKILHIYQFTKIFVQCPGVLENNSYIVVTNKDIVGPNASHQSSISKAERRNERREDRREDRNGFEDPSSANRISFRDFKGKKVIVREGPYKGYQGTIRNIKGKDFMIELSANQRIIKLEQEAFGTCDSNTCRPQVSHMATPGQQPMRVTNYPPSTPAMNSQYTTQTPMPNYHNTPMLNPATPMTPSMARAPPKTPGVMRFKEEPPRTPY
ncbi:transcription initiation factor, putative [Entamoeba histolytica HM-1:IMSS-B]|uniref:Transcription initiation factor SPT5, putative n=6 Tax=Entamoeba histolytica TaxID=5759 RepID=C4LVU5_ENTH1|nr:transcription initiation factor SPT5, putative [Entamoeba histolytica HM-1:IMSS]EMD47826.1 transcription initiation factor SPT5, putative [Entamoeba histolytica KU27]EMH76914.1 transcription initiation factor, putative [Entamoeba histolytica HM-1:IMSS-B]EMS13386.1 transcription initiation factor SPT5, putative [Entamoeba histolytica HM-3:IMSS]ENY59938.1 transcription initiation factor SPT5, putative [Entamoeba histolytica HM-1:IMSS-A]GAT92801.1 transcription initiation factor spt5 putative |eukprot:XP_656458.1 transcription initiation factor SPT5, putative [Entamoeba histolytica HM-1:IMSS]